MPEMILSLKIELSTQPDRVCTVLEDEEVLDSIASMVSSQLARSLLVTKTATDARSTE